MLLDRRFVVRGLAGCICCGGAPLTAQAERFQPRTGCVVRGDEAVRALGAGVLSSKTGGLPQIVEGRARTTGDINLNRKLDAALQRLAQTFNVWPKVGFYDDGDQPNAMAVWYERDGKRVYGVVFGKNYFRKLFEYDPTGISFLQTAAHEFGHVWMYKSGQIDALLKGRTTVKRAELHADFLSGFYLGLRKRDNPKASFRSAGMKRWESGDNFFGDKQHHGSPKERLAAAEAGFRLGFIDNAPPPRAFEAATQYVLKL